MISTRTSEHQIWRRRRNDRNTNGSSNSSRIMSSMRKKVSRMINDDDQNEKMKMFDDICQQLRNNDCIQFRIGWNDCDYLRSSEYKSSTSGGFVDYTTGTNGSHSNSHKGKGNEFIDHKMNLLERALYENKGTVKHLSIGWYFEDFKTLIRFLVIVSNLNHWRLETIELVLNTSVPASVLIQLFNAHPFLKSVKISSTTVFTFLPVVATAAPSSSSLSSPTANVGKKNKYLLSLWKKVGQKRTRTSPTPTTAAATVTTTNDNSTNYCYQYYQRSNNESITSYTYYYYYYRHRHHDSNNNHEKKDNNKSKSKDKYQQQQTKHQHKQKRHKYNITQILQPSLGGHKYLKSLSLIDCELYEYDTSIKYLCDFIRQNHKQYNKGNDNGGIQSLTLRNNRHICHYGLYEICTLPIQNTLDLSLCDFDDESAKIIATAFKHKNNNTKNEEIALINTSYSSNNNNSGSITRSDSQEEIEEVILQQEQVPTVVIVPLGKLILTGNIEIHTRGSTALCKYCVGNVQDINLSYCDMNENQLVATLRQIAESSSSSSSSSSSALSLNNRNNGHDTANNATAADYLSSSSSMLRSLSLQGYNVESDCVFNELRKVIQNNQRTLKSIKINNPLNPVPFSSNRLLKDYVLDDLHHNYVLSNIEVDHCSSLVYCANRNTGNSTKQEHYDNVEYPVYKEYNFYLQLNLFGRSILRYYNDTCNNHTSKRSSSNNIKNNSNNYRNNYNKNNDNEHDNDSGHTNTEIKTQVGRREEKDILSRTCCYDTNQFISIIVKVPPEQLDITYWFIRNSAECRPIVF